MSCILGWDYKNVQESNSELISASKTALATTPRLIARDFLGIMAPSLIKLFKFKLLSDKITKPFLEMTKYVIALRNGTEVVGNDLVQILMETNAKNGGLNVELIAGLSFGFFQASFDTTTLSLTFCLYELARRHDIQERIRQEIRDVTRNTNGRLTYAGIMKMKYLDQVVKETLRLYPPVPNLRRICTEDFTLPNSAILKTGSAVFVSVFALHRDERYFENPEEFKPERFSEENKIHPFTYLPTGGGPRICIGKRFASVQTKVGLVYLLKDYQINMHESQKYPMEFDTNTFLLRPRNPVILNLKKIDAKTPVP